MSLASVSRSIKLRLCASCWCRSQCLSLGFGQLSIRAALSIASPLEHAVAYPYLVGWTPQSE